MSSLRSVPEERAAERPSPSAVAVGTGEGLPASVGATYTTLGPRPSPSAGIECLRVLACIGIVAFHMRAPGEQLAYAGLPAFAVVTVALAARSAARQRSIGAFAAGRARRLLAPWVFWSAVYAVIRTAQAVRNDQPALGWAHPGMLFMGPAFHLWFLPFALVAGVLAAAWTIQSARHGIDQERRFGAWVLIAAASIAGAGWLSARAELPAPLAQWVFTAPAVPLGLALAAVSAGAGLGRWARLAWLAVAVGLACAGSERAGYGSLSVPYSVGVLACATAWAAPWRSSRLVLALSGLSYGVYLVHPFFMLVLWWAAPEHGNAWTGVAAVVAASALATAALRRTALRAVL